jgi:hypothetical protein
MVRLNEAERRLFNPILDRLIEHVEDVPFADAQAGHN